MLPESDRIRPRPVWARYCQRILCEEWGVPIHDPTDEEIRDAFTVLLHEWQPGQGEDPIYFESVRILQESQ